MSGASGTSWRLVKIGLGVILLPLGLLGLFIPVLQGILFLLLAVALLAGEVPVFARWQAKLRERYPEPFLRADRMRDRIRERFR